MQDYNLDKNIEIKGMWYLPAHPERGLQAFCIIPLTNH